MAAMWPSQLTSDGNGGRRLKRRSNRLMAEADKDTICLWAGAYTYGRKCLARTMVSMSRCGDLIFGPREAFADAVKADAAQVIFLRWGPTPWLLPLFGEVNMARRLFLAGQVLNVRVEDYVAACPSGLWSAIETGVLHDYTFDRLPWPDHIREGHWHFGVPDPAMPHSPRVRPHGLLSPMPHLPRMLRMQSAPHSPPAAQIARSPLDAILAHQTDSGWPARAVP